MRIVGGTFAGRRLTSPSGRVRPTAEPVREEIMRQVAGELAEARVLDLFAGSGALGLEAMSRGAARCDFVESGPAALHALKANIAALRLTKRTRLFKRDALPFAQALPAGAYDIAFVDPPYGSRMLDRVIERWLVVPFARTLVAEHDRVHQLPSGARTIQLGDTAISVWRVAPEAQSP